MAKGIKGITVEIGGNTGPLDKALGNVNKTSRSLQVELRQVEKLLKFDPTNTELLAQKQELLSKSVETTEEKLNALKAAEAQVQAQFENGDIGEEQYRAFQREIAKTENELKNMKSSLEVATRNLNEFGDNNGVAKEEAEQLSRSIEEARNALEAERRALKEAEEAQRKHTEEVNNAKKELDEYKDKVKDTAKEIGKGILAIGGSALAGATYAVKLSNDFDKAFNTLITRTGASKEEFDSLNEAMENVYKNNFGESIEDVAQSMAIVKTNTNLAGEELEKATENALLLRDTFEFEVNESTRAAKMLMDQFGLSSDEAYNLIAQGAQKGLDKNGDLLDTINEYGVHFSQIGVSADEMFNMLVNGAQEGTFSVDKLGDAVKEFGIRVKDGTANDAFKTLGLDIDETTKKFGEGGFAAREAMLQVTNALFSVKDPLKQNMLGVQLFGTMWEDLGATGIKALMDTQGEINRTSSALENINNQKYDDIGSALAGLGRTLQVEVIEPLGEELKPTVEEAITYVQENAPQIKDILTQIVSKVGEFVRFVVDNGPTILATISGIGAAFVTWKVASTINGLVKAIKAFKIANEAATLSQAIFNVVLGMNPIMAVVMAISALVAAFITLWVTSEDFRNFWIGLWEDIKTFFVDSWNAISTFFTETIPGWIENFKAWWNGLPEYFGQIWDNVKSKFLEWGTSITNFFTETIPGWIESIRLWFSELPYKIGYALGEVLGNIVSWGVNTYNYFVTNVPLWIESISNWFSELPGKIWAWLQMCIQKVSDWGTKNYYAFKQSVNNTINAVSNWFSELPGKIKKWLTETINKVVEWGSNMVTKAKKAASDTVTKVINEFASLPGKIKQKGKEIVEGLWNGIIGMKDWIVGKISGFCSGIVDGFKNALKINSPSKVMRDKIGVGIVEGIDVGIDKEMPNLNRGIRYNMNSMISNMKSIVDSTAPGISSNLVSSLSNNNIRNLDNASLKIDYEKLSYAFIDAIKQTNLDNPKFNIDGREFMRIVAPYQVEFDNYNKRTPSLY